MLSSDNSETSTRRRMFSLENLDAENLSAHNKSASVHTKNLSFPDELENAKIRGKMKEKNNDTS